ncbi:hypothetical protein MMC09_001683 [Bachmanniomyces sp. S44760]|nr:hypothetical protein [Bachmanniomyces sp. S44760]
MHATFASLASAIVFSSFCGMSLAYPKIHWRRQDNATAVAIVANTTTFDLIAPAPTETPTTAAGSTGQVCLLDDYLLALQEFSIDATPFCSSFISIPLLTAITTDATARSTVITVTTTTSTMYSIETEAGVVVTSTYTTIEQAGQKKRAAITARAVLADSHPLEIIASSACNDTSIDSALSSGCSCLHIPPSTTTVHETSLTVCYALTRNILQIPNLL